MYAKLGLMSEAQDIFDSLPNRDLVLWNTLLSGYAEFGPDNKVLHCFPQIHLDGLFPDVITLACIVRACGNLKSIIIDKRYISKSNLQDMSNNWQLFDSVWEGQNQTVQIF